MSSLDNGLSYRVVTRRQFSTLELLMFIFNAVNFSSHQGRYNNILSLSPVRQFTNVIKILFGILCIRILYLNALAHNEHPVNSFLVGFVIFI